MGDVRIRRPTEADIPVLAATMRPETAAEVMASHALSPRRALEGCLAGAMEAWTAELHGEPAVMFGVSPGPRRSLLGPTDYDVPWVLTSEPVVRWPKAFARASRAVIRSFRARYPRLENMTDARYTASLRWARWLGAEILPAVPWGVARLPFHPTRWGQWA